MGENGQSRVCMNIRSCESIEIKKDGRKVVQPFAPVTELNIMETVHRKGFTTQQVAERLGVTKAAVSQMTSGNPTLSTIYKIAWAIGVDPRDFFYRMASDGTIIEEPKVSFEKLKESVRTLGSAVRTDSARRTQGVGMPQLRHRFSRHQHSTICRGEE